MTAKEYLSQTYEIKQRIKRLDEKIELLDCRATNVTVEITERVKSSGSGDSLSEIVAQKLHLKELRDAEIDCLGSLKFDIKCTLKYLSDDKYKEIIYGKYIEHRSLSDIAKELKATYSSVKRWHGEALRDYQRFM